MSAFSRTRGWRGRTRRIAAMVGIIAMCDYSICPAPGQNRISVTVNLVRLPFVAVGQHDKPLNDISSEELRVSDNGVSEEVKYLWRETGLPLTIAFLVDVSERGGRRTARKYRSTVRDFVASVIGPDDRGLLATLDEQPRILSDVGSSKDELLRAVDQIHYEGNAGTPIGEPCQPPPSPPARRSDGACVGTPIWDAVFHVARSKLRAAEGRKAIVLFTDGFDLGSSLHGLSSAIEAAESAGVTVYTIRYEDACAPTTRQRRLAPVLGDRGMQAIADATGGRAFNQPRRFDAVYRQIEEDLRNQYVLAYTPKNPGDHGTWHRLDVRIARPRTKIRAPSRYQVP
jgi:Ca-activated chloride channel family protein